MAAKKKKSKAKPTKAKAGKKAAPKKAAPKARNAAPKKAARPAPKKAVRHVPKKPAPTKTALKKKKKKAAAAAKKPAPVAAVPPKIVKAVVPPGPPDPTVDLAQVVAALALDRKAEDVIILKVTDLTSYADCFILASAPSERQVQAIARHVGDEMKKAGKAPVGTEGLEQGHWVLVDLGAIVLHVFLSSARQYYDLEGFWCDAPRVDVDEARGLAVHGAMTANNTATAPAPADDDDAAPLAAHDA